MTLPPGRARLVTTPAPTRSPLVTTTIGITEVARLAASVAGVVEVRSREAFEVPLRVSLDKDHRLTFPVPELIAARHDGLPHERGGAGRTTGEKPDSMDVPAGLCLDEERGRNEDKSPGRRPGWLRWLPSPSPSGANALVEGDEPQTGRHVCSVARHYSRPRGPGQAAAARIAPPPKL